MEANTTSYTIFELTKWLFPSLVGAIGAAWYRRKDIKWQRKSVLDKVIYTLLAVCAITFGCVIGFTIAQIIITYFLLDQYWYCFGVHVGCGVVSLKVLDAVLKNTDDILTIMTDGIKTILINFFNKFKG